MVKMRMEAGGKNHCARAGVGREPSSEQGRPGGKESCAHSEVAS